MARIDVHAHCVPPSYREYCMQNDFAGKGHPDGMPAIPPWDPVEHIALMQRLNIKKSILSMSSPGTHLTPGDDMEGRSVTRRANMEMANTCAEYPEHFLFFASLPLPDIEGSLAEIDYALNHLGAVGFQILTNSHGIYPGDPRFNSVFDKLNERKTVAFFHPTSCHLSNPRDATTDTINPLPRIPSPVVEFMFDSTRSLMSLLTSGTVSRCPDITYLVCHCGATFPPVLERIAECSGFLFEDAKQIGALEIKKLLQTHFYFDLAGAPFPDQVYGLLRMVNPSRLLYGSDYPYTRPPLAEALAKRLDKGLEESLGAEVKHRVLLTNAETMLKNVL